MNAKVMIPLVALGILIVMGVYFLINPSYEKSIRAKYYYEMGDYNEAYTLAKEAFSMNVYNRMASTVMAQSKTSLKFVDYINLSKKYMKEIQEIAKHDVISDADRARMRTMCEIMVGSYKKLAPSVITDEALVQESTRYYKEFEQLLEKVNR